MLLKCICEIGGAPVARAARGAGGDGLAETLQTDFQDHRFIATIPDRHKEEIREVTVTEKTKRGGSFTVDQVIAGLSFGFWLNLMGHSVAHILWNQSINAPFPNLPAGVTRDDIYRRLDQFRKFRTPRRRWLR
jgi:hypothetical protein